MFTKILHLFFRKLLEPSSILRACGLGWILKFLFSLLKIYSFKMNLILVIFLMKTRANKNWCLLHGQPSLLCYYLQAMTGTDQCHGNIVYSEISETVLLLLFWWRVLNIYTFSDAQHVMLGIFIVHTVLKRIKQRIFLLLGYLYCPVT